MLLPMVLAAAVAGGGAWALVVTWAHSSEIVFIRGA